MFVFECSLPVCGFVCVAVRVCLNVCLPVGLYVCMC